jgi:hypothetical protein
LGKGACTFKESDVTRAFKAARKAGVDVQVEIDLDRKRMKITPIKFGEGSGGVGKNTTDIVEHMRAKGVTRLGPDWSLSRDAKRPFVRQARQLCRRLEVKFGAGDTEFIPWSDGNGCCGASELTQGGANHFTANFVGAIREALARPDKKVRFESLRELWSPEQSIGNYMDWRRRIPPNERGAFTDWLAILSRRWNGGKSPYSPAFFDGVVATTECDDNGFKIYDTSVLARELAA